MNKRELLIAACAVVGSSASAAKATVIFEENFNSVPLGAPAEEANPGGGPVWSNSPPAGWTENDSAVPGINNANDNNGVRDWAGWNVADRAWWVTTAGDQNRSQFTSASGGVMIADPDEWDDQAHPGKANGYAAPGDLFTASVKSGPISLLNVVKADPVTIEFDSSWRPEGFDDGANINNQTGIVEVIFSNGATSEIVHFDSDLLGAFYHGDNTNEHVSALLPAIPDGADSFQLQFTLRDAANDWWWAVDNVAVTGTVVAPEPASFAAVMVAAAGSLFMRRSRR